MSECAVRFGTSDRKRELTYERDEDHMIVDCGDCRVRDISCADCVVTVLLGAPGLPTRDGVPVSSGPPRIALDQEVLGAMGILAEGGLVPRLRLVTDGEEPSGDGSLSHRDPAGDRRAI